MKANKLTVFLRCAVSLLLCTVLLFSSGIAQGLSDEILNPSWRAKINDDLWEAMESLDDDDIITVWLWKQNEPIRQSINTALRTEKGMDPDVYEDSDRFEAQVVPTLLSSLQGGIMLSDTSAILSRDSEPVKNAVNEVKAEYAAARKEITRREYTEANTDFVEKYVDEEKRSILYFSNYTSTLILEATKSEIIEYAKTSEVTEISLYVAQLEVAEEDIAFSQIHSDSILGTKSSDFNSGLGYKGRGVTIGIIEVGGYFNTEHPQLSGIYGTEEDSQLQIHNNAGENGAAVNAEVSGHATYVTTLLVGQTWTLPNGETYEGIVPYAKAIVTPVLSQHHVINAIKNLAAEGCDIINYSGGQVNGTGYTSYDREVDEVIVNTNVVFVKSAGNVSYNDEDELIENSISVSSPGKAANAITVGNAYTKNNYDSSLSAPYRMLSSSSYKEADFLPNKPDISAPGCNICYVTTGGVVTEKHGTSLAAPIVTGVIAQTLEANPSLRNYNVVILKSILLASADYQKINPHRDQTTYDYCIDDADVGNFLREVSGAGLVNAVKAVRMAQNINSGTLQSIMFNQTQVGCLELGTLFPGEKVRIVLTFNKPYRKQDPSISLEHPIDNLNLSLWMGNTEVVNSVSVYNNVEIIEYVVPEEGGGVYHCNINAGDMYSVVVPYSVSCLKWRPGDLDGDNAVTTTDYALLSNFVSRPETIIPELEYIADVNKDGKIDTQDLSLVRAFITAQSVVLQ